MSYAFSLAVFVSTAAAQCLEVSTDRVRAVDVARRLAAFTSRPAEQEIALSPLPGVTRRLTSAQLSRALGSPVAEEICITRVAHFLTRGEIETALQRALAEDGAKVSVVDFSRAPLPEGQLEFPRSGLSPAALKVPAMWRGVIHSSEGRSTAVWAKVLISKPARAVVARRRLAAALPLNTQHPSDCTDCSA